MSEHWSVKSKFGLDAKGSDYIFKQHITRLEDIYVNRTMEIGPPISQINMSPVSQLYGTSGEIDNNLDMMISICDWCY